MILSYHSRKQEITIRTRNILVFIIIVTYNEIKNIMLLLSRLEGSLKDIPYEKDVIDYE